MSLSDRLAAAARQRADGPAAATTSGTATSGTTLVDAPPADAAQEPGAAPAPRRRIVSGPMRRTSAVEPDLAANPDSLCPTCARKGELGVVDLPGRTADWSCMACGTLWQTRLPDPPAER